MINKTSFLGSYTSKLLTFLLKAKLFEVPCNVREQTFHVLKSCWRQCEFVVAHRARRSQQVFLLYNKWWGHIRLLALIRQLQFRVMKQKKHLLFALASAPMFEWNEKRISDDELQKLVGELDNVKKLIASASTTESAQTESSNDNCKINNEISCECARCQNNKDDGWILFFSNENLKIWKKEHRDYPGQGMYIYKVYGYFEDVTANDFFQVQIDLEYRKEWDSNSVQLYVVDSEPTTNSEVLYWEFLYPRMFYNRDYVYNRRYRIDPERKLMYVVSESVEHPACPETPPIHRVKEYWSHLVIKSKTEFDQPGLEFTILYFDNHGLSVPNYVSDWYSVTGMPDYIMLQKEAALTLARKRENNTFSESNEIPELQKQKASEINVTPHHTSLPAPNDKRCLRL